jgi:hypothetical protein
MSPGIDNDKPLFVGLMNEFGHFMLDCDELQVQPAHRLAHRRNFET